MNCYSYSNKTFEFTGVYPVDFDPVELNKGNKVPLLPANSTLVTVPDYAQNTIPVFDSATESWNIVKDYRKGFKKINDGFEISAITELGDLPEGYYLISDDLANLVIADPTWYKISNGSVVKKTSKEYKAEQVALRQKSFESEFFETSLGWYRQTPSGYANAPQSIQIVDSFVTPEGGLTSELADMIILYKKPNFKREEECTEDWLIANQYKITPMSYSDWKAFCLDFHKRWAQLNYLKINS